MDNLIISRIKGGIAIYLLGVSVLIIPLYIRYGYLHLIAEKAAVYLWLSIPALVLAAVIYVISAVLLVKKEGKERFYEVMRSAAGSHIVILWSIAAWALISSSLSVDLRASFLGTFGWSMGSLTLCVLACSTICIAAWLPFRPRKALNENHHGKDFTVSCGEVATDPAGGGSDRGTGVLSSDRGPRVLPSVRGSGVLLDCILITVAIVHVLIFIFAIIQAAGKDPFGFLSMLDYHYYYSYLSTVGQKNCFAGYLCLLLPLFWGLFMRGGNRLHTGVCGLISSLGLLCAVLADSDSVYAGFGICLLFMAPFALARKRRAERASILLLVFGISLLAAGHMPLFSDRVANMQGLSAMMLRFPGAGGVLLAGVFLLLFSRRWMGDPDGKAVRLLLFLARAAVASAIAAALAWGITHFSDSLGTNRGLIWRVGWEQFQKAPFNQKMIGIGPDMAAVLYAELRISPGINVLSAHCEPLHILLTQGIIGIGLYLWLWGYFFLLWKENSRSGRDADCIWFFPLAAYFGYSLFCPLYPLTAALFSAVSGLCLHFGQKPAANRFITLMSGKTWT